MTKPNLTVVKRESTETDKYSPTWIGLFKISSELLAEDRWKYLGAQLLLFALTFYELAPILVAGLLVDYVTRDRSGALLQLAPICALLGASFVIVAIIRIQAKGYCTWARNKVGYRIRTASFEYLIEDGERNKRTDSGAIAQRVLNGITDFYDLSTIVQCHLFLAISGIIGTVIALLSHSVLLATIVPIYLLTCFSLLNYYGRKMSFLNQQLVKAKEGSAGIFVDSLGNAATIRALGAHQEFNTAITERAENILDIENRIRISYTNQWQLFQGANGLLLTATLYFTARMTTTGVASPGEIVVVFGFVTNLITRFVDVFDAWDRLQRYRVGVTRLGDLVRPILRTMKGRGINTNWSTIKVSDISFTYPGSTQPVLAGVSLEIRRGERVGLVGPSGIGKTTLAKILLGLEPANSGIVKVDNAPYAELSRESIRSEFSIALQECEIFSMSLLDNITLMRKVDDLYLAQVLRVAGLEPLIKSLPDGLKTMLGEKGFRLSGGERQRVSIARALARKPSLLVLDEATVMLDGQLEESVLNGIIELLPELTLVIIAHHERTLGLVSRIITLDAAEQKLVGNL